ncbi:hypothetical protein [Natribacillus halophilus]|uniref:Uncharacterized protein n=1 Tax=Natribacillus halophilus TaxID=549003 RepID=A0A1G8LI02_9BACI|nr:hypothetical protein [Natribacillus halophilus]SDI55067.1 hypothetical protein SAMN04488123_10393 [Natribacillus halophilus]
MVDDRKMLETILEKVTDTGKRMSHMEAKFEGLETKVTGIEAKVEGLETKVTGIETKVKGLETKVEGMDITLAEVKEKADRIPDIERKTDVITKELVSVREDMTTVKGKTHEIEGEQTYQYTKWGEHDRRISKLERKIDVL